MGRRDEIEKTIDRLQVELTRLARYPDEDPYTDGDVIRFEKPMKTGGYEGRFRRYTFVALKAGGRWYRTGAHLSGGGRASMTYDELIEWLGDSASDLELLAPVTQPQPATTADSPADTSQPAAWVAAAVLEDLVAIEGYLSHPDGRDALARVLRVVMDSTGAGPHSRALLVAVDRFLTRHGK